MLRSIEIAAVFVVFLAGTACHKTSAPAPPPPVPTASVPPTPAATPAPVVTPAPQPATPTQTQTPSRRPKPSAPPSQPVAQPASPTQPEFRLGQAVTPDEVRFHNAEIGRHIQRASQVLGTIGNRVLTAGQKSAVNQIRGFIAQAQQMRATDIVRAHSLAERADVLSQDLLSSLK